MPNFRKFTLSSGHRREFITQRCVNQYLGFISDRLHKVRRLLEQHTADGTGLPAEHEDAVAKLLYHAFHKLFDLERIVAYDDPLVRLDDGSPERDFIMKVRTNRPLAGDFAPALLVSKADALREACVTARAVNDAARAAAGIPVRSNEVDLAVMTRLLESIRRRKLTPPTIGNGEDDGSADTPSPRCDVSGSSNSDPTERVQQRLRKLQEDEGINIVFAAECSSRALGTDHAGSDHDIVAIMAHPPARYLSLRPLDTKIRVTYPPTEDTPEVDVTLFECRHAFLMLSESNMTLCEAFLSPIKYFPNDETEQMRSTFEDAAEPDGVDGDDKPAWVRKTRKKVAELFDRDTLAKAAFSHAQGNFKIQIEKKKSFEFPRKKYVHVCRRILCALWLRGSAGAWPLPIRVVELLAAVPDRDGDGDVAAAVLGITAPVRAELEGFLLPGELHKLGEPGERNVLLDTWITAQLKVLKSALFARSASGATRGRARIDTNALEEWDKVLVPLLQVAGVP